MSDDKLREAVLASLAPLPVDARRLFGGYGLYLGDVFFGVISDGTLYFRTDDESRVEYVRRGMPALQPAHRPRGPKTVDRNFAVPAEVMDDPVKLKEWALRARAASR